MPLFCRVLVFAALIVGAVVASSSEGSALAPFDPGGFACFESYESAPLCDGDPSPSVASDIRLRFCVGWDDLCLGPIGESPGSAPALLAGFVPLGFTPVQGNEVPVGAIAGRAQAQETRGVLNNPCSTHSSVSLTMLNATIDTIDEIDASAASAIFLDANGNGIADGVDRYPSFLNEVLANQQPRSRYVGITYIQGFIYMVNAVVLDPGSSVPTSSGVLHFDSPLGYPIVFVLGDPTVEPVPSAISDYCAPFFADLVLFGRSLDNPCTPAIPALGAACPSTMIFENGGYPLLPCETKNSHDEDGDGAVNDGCPVKGAVSEADIPGACANVTNDEDEDTDVNDGCPQVGLVSEGDRIPGSCSGDDEGGCVLQLNPSQPGPYAFTAFSFSYRDADADGIDNTLDVCALVPNPAWNPYAFDLANDPDGDGLPNECDPEPGSGSPQSPPGCAAGIVGSDEDGDCFANRGDNCPLTNQLANPLQFPSPTNLPDQTDTDGDGIGDVCDSNPTSADGDFPTACLALPVTVGVGADTSPTPPNKDFRGIGCGGTFTPLAQDPDIDHDGVCTEGIDPGDSGCTGTDNCPSVANPSQTDSDSDGVGDACENQSQIAVGGFAGLAPDALTRSADTGRPSATLPVAVALVAGGALALSGGAWFALRRRR